MNLRELGCCSSACVHLVQDKPLGYHTKGETSISLQKGTLRHGIGHCRSEVLVHFHILNIG